MSDLRLIGREFDSPPPRGWVTVFGRINHLSISPSQPDQLSLLPSEGREISTSQSEVTFCGPGVKAGLFHFGWTSTWAPQRWLAHNKWCTNKFYSSCMVMGIFM